VQTLDVDEVRHNSLTLRDSILRRAIVIIKFTYYHISDITDLLIII